MTIYNVFNCEEWVGCFLQATFSTKEKAEEYIEKNQPNDYYVSEYELDSE